MSIESVKIESTEIYECGYGDGNLMGMRAKEAPLALARNSLAHQIYQEGMSRISGRPLPKKGPLSEDEATRNNFSFLQIAGVSAGEDHKKVANVSEGLTWDRETPLEEAAKRLLYRIGREEIVRMKRYGYKWVAFVETDRSAADLYDQFINAPRRIWEDELPANIAEVQNVIQSKRAADLETRQWFLNTFEGENNKPLEQGFKKDNKRLFSWDCVATEEDIWAIDADGDSQPMSITFMALSEDTDENTRLMLLDMKDFLKGASGKNRFWIEFNYGPDAVCCNASSNSQYGEANFHKTYEFEKSAAEIRFNNARLFEANICSKCNKPKDEKCNCKNES